MFFRTVNKSHSEKASDQKYSIIPALALPSLITEDPSEKLQIISEFFNEIIPSFNTYARHQRHIANLIFAYIDDSPNPTKTELTYDHARLKEQYMKNNKHDTAKLKPLKVVSMNTEDQRKAISRTIKTWYQLAIKEAEKYAELYDTSYSDGSSIKKRHQLYQKLEFFEAIHVLAMEICRNHPRSLALKVCKNHPPSDFISCVIDSEARIQAISISHPDEWDVNAWYIELILTAPHNRLDEPLSVKGAGSALIEDAILKSIKSQGLSTIKPLTKKDMINTAVTLKCTGSEVFYRNLFFEKRTLAKSDKNLILKNENLFRFFEEYGGRASIEMSSADSLKNTF